MNEDDYKQLLASMELGQCISDFKVSRVGIYLYRYAQLQTEDAWAALATVEPTDTNEIIKLQNQAAQGTNFIRWIEEALEEGIASATAISTYSEEDNG
jgi:hypothetical protein